jgi:uncharacterized membrane protein YedE/YeeE
MLAKTPGSIAMTIDWNNFTPWASQAAALLVAFNGRIAGISGVLGGLLRLPSGDAAWRLAFLLGLAAAPLVYGLAAPLPAVTIEAGTPTLITAGLLVGLGTRYGSGCTSGHGVCGLSRRSPRSLAATAAFMLAGFATVFVIRHLAT